MKLILFTLVLIFLIVPVNAVDWHDDSRLKRVQLNVNNSSIVLTDYQIMKTITYDSDMQPDFDDILFYNESGESVPYWIESKTDSNTADIWLKVPSVSTTEGATLWMYYNNSSVSSESSGDDTFIKWHDVATTAFLDSLTIDPTLSLIYETEAKFDTGSSDIRFGISNTQGRTDDAFTISASLTDNLKWIVAQNENTVSYLSENTVSSGVWYRLKMVFDGSTLKGYYDDDEIGAGGVSSNLPNELCGIFMQFQSSTGQQKWSFVRKFTATEPTWGTDGEEESYEAPPVFKGTYLYPNSTYSVGCYGKLISELVYATGFNFSDIGSCNALTTEDMEVLSVDDTNYIPSIDKDAAHDGYMYGNFTLQGVKTLNFINVKTVHNRNETNPVILGLFNVSTQKWHAVNNSSVEIVDVELTYNITGTDIAKYTTLIDNTLYLSVSLNTNGDGNYDVFVDFVEVYIDYEEVPCPSLECVYNLVLLNQNNISILQNDVDDLENDVNNLYLFVLLCTVFLIATLRKRGNQ
jgi:hypothetical protein